MSRRAGTALLGAGIAAALLLAGCGPDDADATSPASATPTATDGAAPDTSATDTADQAASLTLVDPWVKAAESGMTAAFGTLTNAGSSDVRVVGATMAGARIELHEMVAGADGTMVMQEQEDGFVVPAGGERVLEPGGEHLMIMDMTAPVEAGADVEITLELEDGSTLLVHAPGRTFAGANESYHGDDDATGDGAGHDAGGSEDHGGTHGG